MNPTPLNFEDMFFQNEIDLLNPKKDEDRERLEDIRRKTTDWKVLKSVAEKLEIDETDRINKLQLFLGQNIVN
jgi:hypothetical protein